MAIDDLLDEHEQSQRVRDWLRQNGAGMIGGVVLGLGLIGGWQWWQNHRLQQRMQAGEQFQKTTQTIETGKLDQARPQVAALPTGVYSVLGALDLAKAQLEAGQRDAAIASLRGLKTNDPPMQAIVRQRLARLLIDAGKAEQALGLLQADSCDPQVLQIRGDAYAALGKSAQAQAAYTGALTALAVGSPQRKLVELKLSDVGGMPAKPEARS